jgi:hypothetical protein
VIAIVVLQNARFPQSLLVHEPDTSTGWLGAVVDGAEQAGIMMRAIKGTRRCRISDSVIL